MSDTADLVQDALLQTFRRLTHFEPRRDQALQAYLRMAIDNRIRDEIRRFKRRPIEESLTGDETVVQDDPSALHALIDAEKWDRYKRCVARLDADQRRLVVGRAELGYTYEQLASATGRRRPDAARVALRRALLRLADEMKRG